MAWLRVRAVLLLAVLTAAVSLAAADLPCVGKWKISVAKSVFGESTLTFAAAGPGEMQWTADGVTMKFKMDGKEYPDPWGGTSACKELDSPSWESVNKLKGKLVSTDVHWLSADGKTLTIVSKGTRPDGKSFEDERFLARVSGGPGLPWKWKTSKLSISAPSLIDIAAYGERRAEGEGRGLGQQLERQVRRPGQPGDGPHRSRRDDDGVEENGPAVFRVRPEAERQGLHKGALTASPDGKTLTMAGSGTTEKRRPSTTASRRTTPTLVR